MLEFVVLYHLNKLTGIFNVAQIDVAKVCTGHKIL